MSTNVVHRRFPALGWFASNTLYTCMKWQVICCRWPHTTKQTMDFRTYPNFPNCPQSLSEMVYYHISDRSEVAWYLWMVGNPHRRFDLGGELSPFLSNFPGLIKYSDTKSFCSSELCQGSFSALKAEPSSLFPFPLPSQTATLQHAVLEGGNLPRESTSIMLHAKPVTSSISASHAGLTLSLTSFVNRVTNCSHVFYLSPSPDRDLHPCVAVLAGNSSLWSKNPMSKAGP